MLGLGKKKQAEEEEVVAQAPAVDVQQEEVMEEEESGPAPISKLEVLRVLCLRFVLCIPSTPL